MAYHEVYRDGFVHVLEDRCHTCIFRPGNLVGLEPGRVARMVREATAIDGCIPCHATLYQQGVKPAVCRGFFDLQSTSLMQLALRLNVVKFMPVPEKD